MKTRLIIIAILLLILTVLLSRNDERITDTLLSTINPIKQSYKNFTQNLEDKSHSYIFQKESIEKLSRENRILRKRLLEQMHYMEQVKNIYDVLPDLSRLPVSSISIVETISYVKLNSFSQVILTKPKNLIENKLYGIVQGQVVAGTARVHNNQLYGYLTSDVKCRFSVFIGKSNAPGIALGHEKNEMVIKFIPKWHNVQVGDRVITSGLDDIFFADIPVGIVTKVEVQSSYTVAHIKTYSDIFHPKTFFLINDAKATITEGFDSDKISFSSIADCKPTVTIEENNTTVSVLVSDINQTLPVVSSIPSRIDQTQEESVQPETIDEIPIIEKPKIKRIQRKPKRNSSTLDLF
jgi:rod shape-determining protein MreC